MDHDDNQKMQPDDLLDYSIIGADYLAHGITQFRQWSRKMLSEFGSDIQPFLPMLFENSKRVLEKVSVIHATSEKSKIVARRREIIQQIGAAPLSPTEVYDLTKTYVLEMELEDSGAERVDVPQLMHKVTEDLRPIHPDVTVAKVTSLFIEGGRLRGGNSSRLGPESESRELRELRQKLLSAKQEMKVFLESLRQSGSPLQCEFADRCERYLVDEPEFFHDPDWIHKLESECMAALKNG